MRAMNRQQILASIVPLVMSAMIVIMNLIQITLLRTILTYMVDAIRVLVYESLASDGPRDVRPVNAW